MSDADEVKKLAKNAPKRYEKILGEIKELADYVPWLESKKREAEIVERVVDGLPEDHLVENAPRLLGLMRYDDAKLDQVSGALHGAKQEVVTFVSSGSASPPSVYEVALYAVNDVSFEQGAANARLAPIRQEITVLAEEKQRELSLVSLLRTIHPDLALEFSETLASVAKAPSELVGVDQAEMRLRDVLEHLWGHLKNHAREKCKSVNWHNVNFKSESGREKLARCLAKPDSYNILCQALDEIYQLFKDLSPEGKNISSQDQAQLGIFKTRWLLQLDRLRGLINL